MAELPDTLRRPPARLLARRALPNVLRSKVSPGQGAEVSQAELARYVALLHPKGLVGAPYVTGEMVYQAMRRFHGQDYGQGPRRCDPASTYKDCSGACVAALVVCGIQPGGTVSTTLETWAVNNGGHYVTKEFARTHAGVACARWGLGNGGHIEITGDLKNYGTPNPGHCVNWDTFDRDNWGECFTWPGVIYDGTPAPPPPQPAYQLDEEDDDMGKMAIFTIDNRADAEWRAATVNASGDVYWMGGAADFLEFLCGPSVPDATRRTPFKVGEVYKKVGVGGSFTRQDIYCYPAEGESFFGYAHVWRNRDRDRWVFELKTPA